jgi:phosphoglycerate dehydrogenase-like enzyme
MNQENEAALQSFADVVSERDRDTPLSSAELSDRLWGCSAILSLNGIGADEITPGLLRQASSIKVICVAHYWGQLDEAAKAAGVSFTEGSNACTVAVAEWTVAAALIGIRKIQDFDRSLKAGSPWAEPRRNVGLLCESTIGLIGFGRIGWHVAHFFKALGANVIAYDKYCSHDFAASAGVQLHSLQDVLKKADVISLHLPVTAETKGALGAREFAMIKDGGVFINSARAALYDEAALIAELKKKRFTAYLDVFSAEPLSAEHPFRTMSNVTITPHIAGDNGAMFLRCGREAIQTLQDYFEGRGLRNLQYSHLK